MAKIPRINQGDRPSTARVDTTAGPDKSMSTLFSGIADVAGAGAMAAVNVEAAERAERNAALVAEQKRLKEAADAKQKIVDAAEAGKINMEIEDAQFSDIADIMRDSAIPLERKVEEFTVRTRKRANELQGRSDINDNVKLAVVKNAEAAMASGLAQMHNRVEADKTKKAKADIAAQFNGVANRAAYLPDASSAAGWAEASAMRLTPMAVQVLGPAEWSEEKRRLDNAIANRYSAYAAKHNPLALLEELKSSKFLLNSLTEDEHKTAVAAAENGYKTLNDTRNMEIASEAFSAGETLANVLGTDEFIETSASELAKLKLERKSLGVGRDANGNKLRPEDAKKQMDNVDKRIKRIKTLQEMNYKQLDFTNIDDVDTLSNVTEEHNKLFTAIKEGSAAENMEGLLKFQDLLEKARDAKKIRKTTYDEMKGSISFAYSQIAEAQAGKHTWMPWLTAERAGVAEIKKQFKGKYAAQPLATQNNIWVEYTRRIQEVSKSKDLTAPLAVKIAQQVISSETQLPIDGAFD